MLTTKVSKWTEPHDKKLLRLFSYLHYGGDYTKVGVIGNVLDELRIRLLADANFAGDHSDMASTSGVFMALYGPHCFFPLSSLSKRHACQCLSTIEAKNVTAVKTLGSPVITCRAPTMGH